MNRTQKLCFMAAYLTQAPLAVAAQGDAADPSASVPPVTYRSAFTSYRAYQDEPIANWRALNEEVGRIGGHVGIFTRAEQGAGGTPKVPAQAPLGEGQPPVRGAPKAPDSRRESKAH